ncbi:MAG TPA: MmcB family DNA repair protein [Stellaceae bacterium]|nr:MmcB family DNA repair protein [Stellaceae bacterium]
MPSRPNLPVAKPVADLADVGPAAKLLARGTCRALEQLGYATLLEFPLANGRRADILALSRGGNLIIVEIKSSVADFRADRKWRDYREFADRFYFAIPRGFPMTLIPEECGLIVADAFAAAVIRDGAGGRLVPGRRKALTLRFALTAAARLRLHLDPQGGSGLFRTRRARQDGGELASGSD